MLKFLHKPIPEDFSVKRMLHQNIARNDPPRGIERTHASALTNPDKEWCPRAIAIQDLVFKLDKPKFLSTSLATTFDAGRDFQKRINEDYLVSKMVGNWECKSCGAGKNMCKKPPQGCGHTKNGIKCQWSYEEVRITCPETGVSCGIDGLVEMGNGKLLSIETKIMAPDAFKDLKAPLSEHRIRTNIYLSIIKAGATGWTTSISSDSANMIYLSRGFGIKDDQIKDWGLKDAAFSPFKEYTIQHDPSIVKVHFNKAKALKGYRDGKTNMPCGVCSGINDKRAKDCPVAQECFSGKYPREVSWYKNDGTKAHEDAKHYVQLIAKG